MELKITSKRIARLKKIGNKMRPIIRIGKEGISDNIIDNLSKVLVTRELIKVRILNNSDEEVRDVAEKLSQSTDSRIVSVIGKTILLFKENPKKPKISEELKEI